MSQKIFRRLIPKSGLLSLRTLKEGTLIEIRVIETIEEEKIVSGAK